jgi:hypothetical protein
VGKQGRKHDWLDWWSQENVAGQPMRFFLLSSVTLLCLLNGAHGESYDNRDYGFHVEVPGSKTVCLTIPRHGLVILLNSSDCNLVMSEARIRIFVGYNTPSEAKTTTDLTREICGEVPSRPTDMKLNDLKLRRCVSKIEGNFMREDYFTLRPMPGEGVGQWIVFEISLYCQQKDLGAGSKILRKLLSGMRLTRQW